MISDKMNEHGIRGINDYYILNDSANTLKMAATLEHPQSGRKMNVYTTYPGVMLYTGDYLQSAYPGHAGIPYKSFDGLCLECQFYPDAPNQPAFPSTVLRPGETYRQEIIYEFITTSHEPNSNL